MLVAKLSEIEVFLTASTVDLSQFSYNSDLTTNLFPSEIKDEDGRPGRKVKHTVYAPGRGSWIELGENLKKCNAIKAEITTCTKLLENVKQLKTFEFDNIGAPKLSDDQ